MIVAVEKGNGVRASSAKKASYDKKKIRQFPSLPPFLCGTKKAAISPKQWPKDRFIHLLELEFLPSIADQKDARCCPYIEGKAIHLPSREFLMRISPTRFYSKKSCLYDLPFPKHAIQRRPNDDALA